MSNEVVQVYELDYLGRTVVYQFAELIDVLSNFIEDSEQNEDIEFKIKPKKMKKFRYDELPEFQGY